LATQPISGSPRAEQRELSRYVDLDMLGNVMAIDRIPA
jgi:dethiobiotin synthetase